MRSTQSLKSFKVLQRQFSPTASDPFLSSPYLSNSPYDDKLALLLDDVGNCAKNVLDHMTFGFNNTY